MSKMVSDYHAIVYEGVYKNIKFTVCFLRGGYYTCYLDVTKTSLYGIDYNDIDLPVHWGLTYGENRYPWEKEKDITDKYIIGWDYGHCYDAYDNITVRKIFGDKYHGYQNILGNDYHTKEELIEDCKEAIDTIYINGWIK